MQSKMLGKLKYDADKKEDAEAASALCVYKTLDREHKAKFLVDFQKSN